MNHSAKLSVPLYECLEEKNLHVYAHLYNSWTVWNFVPVEFFSSSKEKPLHVHANLSNSWTVCCLSTIRFDGTQWGVTECASFQHFTITPLHHSKYTCYGAIWLRSMLIVLNYFGLSTYVLTEKRWISGLNDLRTNNTLITSIYLCCVDTWKQLYTSTIGCYLYAWVGPCRWIPGSVISKHFIRPTC